ncbi:MAG: capsule assembly Wzi family protein [Bacteroidales bacterium]
MKYNPIFIYIILFLFISIKSNGQTPYYYKVSTELQAGKGSFAPYYFSSNNHGVASIQPNSGYLRGGIFKQAEADTRFSYGLGTDIIASYNNNSKFWIQQLYGELKYQHLGLIIGSKEYSGVFKNEELSSGGLVWSGNSRPIPQVRIGIPEFIAVPGTKGWLQIKGDISYGLFLDKNWLENHYNYQYSFLTTGVWYHQKKVFFRSKEDKPFIVTIGGEFSAQFGGKQSNYKDGELQSSFKDHVSLKDFLSVLIPRSGDNSTSSGDQAYYYGNHLGSWHCIFEYNARNKSKLKAYFEWLFEDGSGIGKMNGWDGLWGIEFNSNRASIVSSIVMEYLQTTNQGGPIHWAPNDYPGTELTSEATGADDYYNNFFYTGWANYGMSNGSPLLKSPAYNKDGYLRFTDNRVRAYHIGLKGFINNLLQYRLLMSYRQSWGTPFLPSLQINKNQSYFIELKYRFSSKEKIQISGAYSIDRGNMYDNNWGVSLNISLIHSCFNFH